MGTGPIQNAMVNSTQEMATAIVQYLREHPKASDTLVGIADWWIMQHQVQVELTTLKEALVQLMEEGVLNGIGEGDSRLYSLKVNHDGLHS